MDSMMIARQIPPGELKPYEENAKIHPPEQIERIAESIKAFGWKQPIVVDRDNTIIIGHGRYYAALELRCKTVPVVVADDLTPEQCAALRLADNKTNESDWDMDKVESELARLNIVGVDMTRFGFEDLERELSAETYIHGFTQTGAKHKKISKGQCARKKAVRSMGESERSKEITVCTRRHSKAGKCRNR